MPELYNFVEFSVYIFEIWSPLIRASLLPFETHTLTQTYTARLLRLYSCHFQRFNDGLFSVLTFHFVFRTTLARIALLKPSIQVVFDQANFLSIPNFLSLQRRDETKNTKQRWRKHTIINVPKMVRSGT